MCKDKNETIDSIKYATEIICPFCKYENSDSWEYTPDDDGEYICPNCGEESTLEVHLEVTYSTFPNIDEEKGE